MKSSPPHIVFDLDDTLYPEIAYVRSCFRFVSTLLSDLFGLPDCQARLEDLRRNGVNDPIGALFEQFALPASSKSETVAAMRAHVPSISLSSGASAVLEALEGKGRAVSIITDGRSVTQRRKLQALGLLGKVRPYISTETGFQKPSKEPFLRVMENEAGAASFWYVADNPLKDFVAPNALGWTTVMLLTGVERVHQQIVRDEAHAAKHVVESLEAVRHLPGFEGWR